MLFSNKPIGINVQSVQSNKKKCKAIFYFIFFITFHKFIVLCVALQYIVNYNMNK